MRLHSPIPSLYILAICMLYFPLLIYSLHACLNCIVYAWNWVNLPPQLEKLKNCQCCVFRVYSPPPLDTSSWSFQIGVFACFALCFKSWILARHTFLREPKNYAMLAPMLHLNLYELWNCSSASLISFWARRALLFLKKCVLALLRFIWELLKNLRNSLFLHLNYFERNKKNYAHDLHLYLFELMKSNTWKLVPRW